MKVKILDKEVERAILTAQKNEITEHLIYEKLAQSMKDPNNKEVLKRTSSDELKHHDLWKNSLIKTRSLIS